MAIRITEDGVVNYENSPDVNRKLFPNLNICGKEIDELEEEINGKAPAVFSTASGSIASFDDGADNMPIKSCIVSFEPIQEGEGDPSPENVRPISGRTGLTVYHTGTDTSDPTEISVNWETEAGVVYGGYVDVVSGVLVIDRAAVVYDGSSDEKWAKYGTGSASAFAMRINVAGMKEGAATSNIVISNELKSLASNNPWGSYDSFISTQSGSAVLVAGIKTITTVADWRTYLASSPLQVVYELEMPTEIQLTPQEIRTLLGENNIWSDAGNISIDYPVDTKTYIDDLSIKTVEVSGQTPTITAEENTRYICGEVTSLSFTPSETGICDVRFTAASISTVLTLPETVKLPAWFDPTLLEAGTTYEINVLDGIYGVVMSWA